MCMMQFGSLVRYKTNRSITRTIKRNESKANKKQSDKNVKLYMVWCTCLMYLIHDGERANQSTIIIRITRSRPVVSSLCFTSLPSQITIIENVNKTNLYSFSAGAIILDLGGWFRKSILKNFTLSIQYVLKILITSPWGFSHKKKKSLLTFFFWWTRICSYTVFFFFGK